MIKSRIFVLIGLALSLFACKKQQHTHRHVEPALLAAYNFKMGSYWIYKDSITGQIDSMYVSRYDSGFVNINNTGANTYDLINIWVNIYDGNTSHNEVWWIQLYDKYINYSQFGTNFDGVENVIKVPPLIYPFSDTSILFSDSCIVRIDPTIMISGRQFTNVAHINFYSIKSYSIGEYNDHFYLDSKVGLLKFVFNHESDTMLRIMELQRYNIVK